MIDAKETLVVIANSEIMKFVSISPPSKKDDMWHSRHLISHLLVVVLTKHDISHFSMKLPDELLCHIFCSQPRKWLQSTGRIKIKSDSKKVIHTPHRLDRCTEALTCSVFFLLTSC